MNINWYPGHMVKTKREIEENLKLVDLVIEILDARIPLASQNPEIAGLIGNKKRIILLNKCDLANDTENDKWVRFFASQNVPAILTDANSGKGIKEVIHQIHTLGQEEIASMQAKGRIGKSIRVMVVGIPNVGKSSLINRISKRNAQEVGNRPGVTKVKKWIRLDNQIELLDTPGVLWPKFESQEVGLLLSFTGTIKDEILEKTEVAFYLLQYLLQYEQTKLLARYDLTKEQIEEDKDKSQNPSQQVMEVMNRIGRKRGAIMSGGKIDEEKIAGILIDDFRSGKIGKITLEKVK